MKFYKVVTKDLYSARTFLSGFRIQYKLEEWTYPIFKESKIFVFNNLSCAKHFSFSFEKIYECEVLGEPEKAKSFSPYSRQYSIVDFWINNVGSTSVPSGTYFVDAVKLIREIK